MALFDVAANRLLLSATRNLWRFGPGKRIRIEFGLGCGSEFLLESSDALLLQPALLAKALQLARVWALVDVASHCLGLSAESLAAIVW